MNVKSVFKKSVVAFTLLSTMSVIAGEFKFVHVLEQGYWYSRYNLGNLVMRSGNGETFMPKMEMVQQMVKMVSDDTSVAVPAKNVALLKRVYNTGNPAWTNKSNRNPKDFINNRWEEAIDKKTSLESFGWTLIKEVEWSKQFNVDFHFGSPNKIKVPGAQQRFAGLVLCVEALMQTKEFVNNPSAFDSSEISGQYIALSGVANLAQYISTKSTPLMGSNRCSKVAQMMNMQSAEEITAKFLMLADKLYSQAGEPQTIREKSLAIQALTWYASANESKRTMLVDRIKSIAKSLIRVKTTDVVELAYLTRGLVEASRVTKSTKFMKLVGRNFKKLVSNFNTETGIFNSKDTYSTEDVAAIMGALNSAKLFAGTRVDQSQLNDVFINFFNTVMNKAKMQISAPPVKMIAAYERNADTLLHRSPYLPMPGMAGADNGIAPVYASSITFKNGIFSNDSKSFDTAGAMHLANEMIWFHNTQVDGFPKF